MSDTELWQPSADLVNQSLLTRFAQRYGFQNTSYEAIHKWSVDNREAFWDSIWDFCGVVGDKGDVTLKETVPFKNSQWYPDGQLNFAENLLRFTDDHIALVEIKEDRSRNTVTYAELKERVAKVAQEFTRLGISESDRIAAWLPNTIDTAVSMLAASSIGAIWSSCSPDFGVSGALDRFAQIEPKLLLATDKYQYNGRVFDVSDNVQEIRNAIPSIQHTLTSTGDRATCDFIRIYESGNADLNFSRLPFSHPLYIMFSSGTTGRPKCIVHGAGGTLIQHLKEHQLHVNLDREDVLFFFTTTGWMMWNWLMSGLASGCTLILYDGSPFYPAKDTLIGLIDDEQISVFGVGARYLASIERLRVKPQLSHRLESLKCILSTGSPLSPESFDYVYRDFKKDVWLASISGGTDIISCFVLGVPWLPVQRGEIQGSGLGMNVQVFDEQGQETSGTKGELVCTQSFPSTPLGFYGDTNNVKFHDAYFSRFPGVWAHGDFAERRLKTGGFVIHGRSDAILNPGGVRIGTAEIYRQLEHFEEVTDAICVSQEWDNDTRVVLFVVLEENQSITRDLRKSIRNQIRTGASPRHVPSKIIQVADIPRTRSGKIAELAVREIIHGREVKNSSALENPECLDLFKDLPALTR